eukprot:15465914-Alexandrium_andersonii.AAC.1
MSGFSGWDSQGIGVDSGRVGEQAGAKDDVTATDADAELEAATMPSLSESTAMACLLGSRPSAGEVGHRLVGAIPERWAADLNQMWSHKRLQIKMLTRIS